MRTKLPEHITITDMHLPLRARGDEHYDTAAQARETFSRRPAGRVHNEGRSAQAHPRDQSAAIQKADAIAITTLGGESSAATSSRSIPRPACSGDFHACPDRSARWGVWTGTASRPRPPSPYPRPVHAHLYGMALNGRPGGASPGAMGAVRCLDFFAKR